MNVLSRSLFKIFAPSGIAVLSLASCSSIDLPLIKESRDQSDDTQISATPSPQTENIKTNLSAAQQIVPVLTPTLIAEDLLGRTPDQIRPVLGNAAFSSSQGEGRLERFSSSICQLIIIYANDPSRNRPQAETLNAVPLQPQEKAIALQECLNDFSPPTAATDF